MKHGLLYTLCIGLMLSLTSCSYYTKGYLEDNPDSFITSSVTETTTTFKYVPEPTEDPVSCIEGYLQIKPWSYKELLEQLIYEGYSSYEAIEAIDSCDISWDEQAAITAKQYMDANNGTKEECKDYLLSRDFSELQADYGVKSLDNSQVASTKNASTITLSQENALCSALNYLDYMPFSYSGLIEQLKYEKYSDSDARYAADHCGANWNEQAAKKAQQYLDYMSFSKEGLIEQLEYEGFTHSQALYGVSQVGF